MFQDGQRLGEFEILGRLGQGAMGAVYKARQTSLNRLVALKTLQASIAADPEFIARFRREAMAAAALSHQNLVQVHAAGENDGLHWFAMEYVEGESAQARLKRKERLDPAESIAIGIHVASALEYGWRKAQLIHRDIKPDNIFLSGDGEVKLGDLGLAKSAGEAQSLTMTGSSMGTPHYISPEQAEGKKDVDLRADIYSLGCTLFHLVAGKPPYSGETALAVMMKHVSGPVPDPQQAWPGFPGELARVVTKMMAKDPSARQQTYAEVIVDLRRAHDALTGATVPMMALVTQQAAAARQLPEGKKRPSAAVLIGGGIALLAGIAALFYFAPWKKGGPLAGPERAEKAHATELSAAPGRVVNLLALVDPQRGGIAGDWKMTDGELHGGGAEWARLAFDYEPPPEYDLHVVFTRHAEGTRTSNAIAQHITLGGHDVMWLMGGFDNKKWTFEKVSEKQGDKKFAMIQATVEDGRRYDSTVQVRRDGFKVIVDGKEVVNYKTDGSDLSVYEQWKFPDPKKLGIGTQNDAVFHVIEVKEIKTVLANPDPAAATKDAPFVNTLGMKFVPVPGTQVLFSVWETRAKDYAEFARANTVDDAWTKLQKDGVPIGREPDHPVCGVSWEDADAFCKWLTEKERAEGKSPKGMKYRLPSDEEWSRSVGLAKEKYATPSYRSGLNNIDYPWGIGFPPPRPNVGNYADETFHEKFPNEQNWINGYTDGFATTAPVEYMGTEQIIEKACGFSTRR